MIVCVSVVSVVISPLSFLILFIWVLSLFFLVSLARGLLILFIFKKETALGFIDLFFLFFFLFLFPLDLFYFLSAADSGFCSFSNSFRWLVRLFIWKFSYFLKKACVAVNFPLRTAFAVSNRFCEVVSIFIYSLIHWLYRRELFNFYIFVNCLDFLLWLISSFI